MSFLPSNITIDNLKTTLLGGQAFNWDLIDAKFYGFFKDSIVKIEDTPEGLKYQVYPDHVDFDIEEYLDLNRNYESIKERISIDSHILAAINHVKDVRILNQDFEQTLLSFILTSHKNIKAVRKLVRDLSRYFGTEQTIDGKSFYTFPGAQQIANSSEQTLRLLGAGFRSKYLLDAAQSLVANPLSNYTNMSEDDLRQFLTSFKGVGEKIADCVMVFALKQTSVTPLDVWAKRVLVDLYQVDSKMQYSAMRNWYRDYFKDDAAFAGQYLFEYYRDVYNKNSKQVTIITST